MTSDGLLILQALFAEPWRLLNSWHIPGTNVSPAMFLIFLMVGSFGLRFFLSFVSELGPAQRTTAESLRSAHHSYAHMRLRRMNLGGQRSLPGRSNVLPPHT